MTRFATRKTIRQPVSKNFVFFPPSENFFALSSVNPLPPGAPV
ncbi:hypothetical protein BACCAP_04390 [Pseudoflavonifractor capillosus ATCC 29799]|uniref:Uncharacterized protein n=1 Tax=Pseudoflavonifractor capillosus ATCC 29799 TaxID=411467 RepID=A6P1M3_9FIRM|nr:hypothetical protein BACCAP_04390 [Pseudoflavonifractor capillosus ATCC 29799]